MTTPEGFRDTCFFCGGDWDHCKCPPSPEPDDPRAPGFDHDDFWIVDPKVDASGRFFVDPFVYYGDAYREFLKSKA